MENEDSYQINFELNQKIKNVKDKINDLNNFKQFLLIINVNNKNFLNDNLKYLNDLYINQKKSNNYTTNIIDIYNIFIEYYKKYLENLNNFNDIVISPFEIFIENLTKNYIELINQFQNISNSILEIKKSIKNQEINYLKISKEIEEFKEITNSNVSKLKNLILLKEKIFSSYSYLINNSNNLITMYNTNYNSLQKKIIKIEEGRLLYIKNLLNKLTKYIDILKEQKENLAENIKNKIINKYNIDNELNTFKLNEKNYCLYGERFNKFSIKKFNNIKTDFINYNCINTLLLNNENDIINEFINKIFDKDEINFNILKNFIEKISNNRLLSQNFINYFNLYNNNQFYIITNKNNFNSIKDVFNIIINNFINKKNNKIDDYNELYYIIIICEKIFYYYNKNKEYLCSNLSFYNILNKNFWFDIIENKFSKRLEELIEHLNKIDIIGNGESNNKNKLNKFLNNLYKKYINNENELNFNNLNTNNIETNILEETGITKKISNYNSFSQHKKPYLLNLSKNELNIILKEFIIHLSNFSFEKSFILDIIVPIAYKYKLNKFQISYYNLYINSWNFSIKKNIKISKNSLLSSKIYDIKNKRFDLIKGKFPINNSIKKMNFFEKNIILLQSSSYLNLNEILNVMLVNKEFYSKNKKKIFKLILLKYNALKLNQHINIWKILINFSNIKSKYNYKQIKSDILKNPISNKILNIIKLDVKRTLFKENIEINREILINILSCIAFINPKINYCQGMNFISSFLLQINNYNEEETFYFLLSIIENTEFSVIYTENLNKLKCFFFIFERLIHIYTPEVYFIFISNNINVNYFSPSWFLTLFTNSCSIINLDKQPEILLNIWDFFFLKGWKALLNIGILIIIKFEKKLINSVYEEIIHFLINGVLESEFFDNSFIKEFHKLKEKYKIKKELIESLEKEYLFENKENE